MNSIIFITLALSAYESSFKNDEQWIGFKEKYSKDYQHPIEEMHRYNNFKANDEKISIHNQKFIAGEVAYTMGHNQFSDMTIEEFTKTYLSGLKLDENFMSYPTYPNQNFSNVKAPESLSYQKFCLPPLNQGNCGSCWAFAAAAQIEVQMRIKYSQFKDYLSPQYVLDCSRAGSCAGGDPGNAQTFMKDYGLVLLNNYQYVGYEQGCRSSAPKLSVKPAANFAKYVYGNEENLKNYLVNNGPVVVLITASNKFMHYSGHVFWDSSCPSSCDMNVLNHAVLLVGYGSENVNGQKLDYWLIKNSWSANWGESGYIKMIRNWKGLPNNCNVGCVVDYALLQ